MSDDAEDVTLLRQEITILYTHLRDHANLRGEIRALDAACILCRTYFADKLTVMIVGAA
jgi:hypothetical protein